MKVISIIQPWATLIALGEKRFETRSWSTKHRGQLAIHASAKPYKKICAEEPYRSILAKHGYTADSLPTGVMLAKARLAECHLIKSSGDKSGLLAQRAALLSDDRSIEGNEFEFGDYTPGRFAWELIDVQLLKPFVPARGQLGLWNWEA